MTIDRGMDKNVVHIERVEYYKAIKKNEILPSAATWMDQENIIFVKYVRQRKTNTICYYFYV